MDLYLGKTSPESRTTGVASPIWPVPRRRSGSRAGQPEPQPTGNTGPRDPTCYPRGGHRPAGARTSGGGRAAPFRRTHPLWHTTGHRRTMVPSVPRAPEPIHAVNAFTRTQPASLERPYSFMALSRTRPLIAHHAASLRPR
jgi:hypothetical protein